MMGSSRTEEKGKAPAYANRISPNTHPYGGLTFFKGNVEDDFDSILDTRLSMSGWDDVHRSVAQGVPDPILNPRGFSMNSNYLQNPQTNLSCNFGGESSFRSVTGSSSLVCPRDTEPVHTRNNVELSTNQSGVLGKFVSSSQLDSREIKIASDCKATGQAFDDGFRCSQSNKGFGSNGSLNGGSGSNPRHILHRQHHARRLGRADKLKVVAPTELKMVRARKATRETLDADFMGFQRKNSGFVNQFSNVDRMASTNYEAGVHSTFNSRSGSSRQSIFHKQKNKGGNVTFGDMDISSRMTFNYTPSEHIKRSRLTANSPNYAGQVSSQNDVPTRVLGDNLTSQRAETPQVSWVGRGLAGINALFSKRLRNSPQSPKGHLSPMRTSLHTTNIGQICQFKDEGSIYSTRMPPKVLKPIDRSDGAFVSYPASQQEPFLTYGQSQNAPIQLARGPRGTPSTNASSVGSQSQKLDFHVRPHHKRTAVAPPSASHWVQNKKRIHPTVQHSMPKPPNPVTTGLIHPSIPVGSEPIAAHPSRVIPQASNVRPRVHVASAPAVSHITWKDPDVTFKLSGYKCFLCKKDVGLTSEGAVFQPAVPQPVAVLPCGHTFHDKCLQNITPDDHSKDPPCIPCAITEN